MTVDVAGFDAAMERQRAEARASWKGSGEQAEERIWFELRETLGATEFLGYDHETAEAQVRALVVGGEPVQRAEPGTEVMVVTNQTPFYGESGGQIGDTGTIRRGPALLRVSDTQKKLGDLHVHIGRLEGGPLEVGDVVEMAIDGERRARLRRAHSATHLLHAALRRHLGSHVTQKGSLVAPDRLRFDFSHPKAVTPEELAAIEAEVNAFLRQNAEVAIRLVDRDAAIAAGAMALFGEKYGDEVRVVSMGREADGRVPGSQGRPPVVAAERYASIELCGGTHCLRTGDIALFKITGESAVAAGIRRIEALTGEAAYRYVRDEERLLGEAAEALRVAPQDLPERVLGLVNERRRLEQEMSKLRQQLATGGAVQQAEAKDIAGIRYLAREVEGMPARDLRGMADAMLRGLGSGVAAVVSVVDGKATLVVSVSDDLKDAVNAVDLVRAGVARLGGKGGGGRADFAQGGGPEGERAGDALAAIADALHEIRVAAE
jgi:alanyl-tRNA synthetase